MSKELISLSKKDFITSYAVALHMVDAAVGSHKEYWGVIKACQRHIAGEKPINPDELKKKGLSWVWNYNFYKARAKLEKGTAENVSKVSSAIALGYATFRNFDEADRKDDVLKFLEDDQMRGVVAAMTGYCLCNTLSKETRLSGFLNEVEYPTYAFGYAAMQFDVNDWMPDVIHPLNIAFEPNTKPSEINRWVVFDTIKADVLYDRWIDARNEEININYEEEDGGKEQRIASSGWNLAGLEELLKKSFRGRLNGGKEVEQWESIVPEFINNPSWFIIQTNDVHIAKIFSKELDGSLTEAYIAYNNPWSKENKDGDGDKVQIVGSPEDGGHLLFKKNYSEFEQWKYIHIIRDSGFSETGFIQGLRGIAKYSVEDSIRYNRVRNGIGNKMNFVGTPMFERTSAVSNDAFKLTISAGFAIVPTTHRLVEKQPSFDIASHINVLRFEEGEFTRDTQQFDPSIEGRLTSRPNKSEVQQVSQEVALTENSKNNVKFRDYSGMFYAVMKRMPSVKCEKGDPGYGGMQRFYAMMRKMLPTIVKKDSDVDAILSAIDSYVIEPIISNVEIITVAIQMAETPFARNRLKRMLLLARGFPIEEVNIAVPMIVDKFQNMQDDRIAAFENDMFFNTNEIIISGTDDHILHLTSHQAKADRVVMGVQEGRLPPQAALAFLENSIAHQLQHFEILAEDPILNKQAEPFLNKIKELNDAKNEFARIVKQQQAQAQADAQQQNIDPETQHEILQKDTKLMSDIQRKDQQSEWTAQRKDRQVELNHEARIRELQLKYQPSSLS